MLPETLLHLRARASSGDLDALTALGMKLLLGEGIPAVPQEGVACLMQAASRGHAEATAQLALITAFGVMRPRNLADAITCLRRAAALGWALARQELQLLARGATDVSVAALTALPPVRIVSESPRIRVYERFATPAECEWLIERGRNHLKRALVYRKDAEGHHTADSRTNTESDYTYSNASVLLALMRDRIAAAAGIATEHFEVAKLLHYEPGEEFRPHGDFQETSTPALAREVERRGQRVATFLIYLNDDYEGGETDFPRVGVRHKGARGDALLFFNVDAAGQPDFNTIHAGQPTTRGEKWLFSQWIRSKPLA